MQLMRNLLLATLLAASLPAPALAESTPAPAAAGQKAAVQKLTELLNQAQTLNGRFSQLTLDGSGTRLQESSGSMAIKRPGLLRWHTDPPMEQLLVSDGKKVWLYDPDLMQVTIQTLDQRMTHTPALLLSGDVGQISQNFDISYRDGGTVVDFILKPKAKDSLFDSLRLSFRNGGINDMQLVDSIGQRTNIVFMGVKVNEALDDAQFHFKIPQGADVIEAQ